MLAHIGFGNIWSCVMCLPSWMIIIGIVVLLSIVVMYGLGIYSYIVCLLTQHKILRHAGPNARGIAPGWVWLQMIPGIHLVMSYIAAWHVSETVKRLGFSSHKGGHYSVAALGFLNAHAAALYVISFWWDASYYAWVGIGLLWFLLIRKYVFRLKEVRESIPANPSAENLPDQGPPPSLIARLKEKWRANGRLLPSVRPLNFILTPLDNFIRRRRLTYLALLIGGVWFLPWLVDLFFDSWYFYRLYYYILTGSKVFYAFALYFILAWLFILIQQYRALCAIGPSHRTIGPGYIWLQTIPLLNFIFSYIMSWHTTWSVKIWSNEQGRVNDHAVKDLGVLVCHGLIIFSIFVFLPNIPSGYPGSFYYGFSLWLMLAVAIFWTLLVRQYLRALNDTLTSATTTPENSVKEVHA